MQKEGDGEKSKSHMGSRHNRGHLPLPRRGTEMQKTNLLPRDLGKKLPSLHRRVISESWTAFLLFTRNLLLNPHIPFQIRSKQVTGLFKVPVSMLSNHHLHLH